MYGDNLPKFLLKAVECSVYLSPEDSGLSAEELREAARLAGYKPGETQDAIEKVWPTGPLGKNRYPPPATPGRMGFGLDSDFHVRLDPDYRSAEAFEFVRKELRELARKMGEEHGKLRRDELLRRGVAAKHDRRDTEVAIAILTRSGILEEKGGLIGHAPNRLAYPMPSEQIALTLSASIKRPVLAKAYGIVQGVLVRRARSRVTVR